MACSKTKGTAQVESLRHNDKRKNILTEELRDFVTDDVKHPKTMGKGDAPKKEKLT